MVTTVEKTADWLAKENEVLKAALRLCGALTAANQPLGDVVGATLQFCELSRSSTKTQVEAACMRLAAANISLHEEPA